MSSSIAYAQEALTQTTESKTAESKTAESKTAESKTAESKTAQEITQNCVLKEIDSLDTFQRVIHIDQMECEFCAKGIEAQLRLLKSVTQVELRLEQKEVILTLHKDLLVKKEELCEAVKAAGYQVTYLAMPQQIPAQLPNSKDSKDSVSPVQKDTKVTQ